MASKKLAAIFALFITLSIILSSVFVIAQDSLTVGRAGSKMAEKVTDLINGIQDVGKPIFDALLGETKAEIVSADKTVTETAGEILFIKILVFFLVVLVVYGILGAAGNPFGEGWINTLVGVIISILGIRFLPPGFLETAAIPSSALAGFMVLVVPFVLVFFFIQKVDNRALKKVLWISYIIVILFLWLYNFDNEKMGKFWHIYWVIALAAFAALKYDGTIERWFRKEEEKEQISKETQAQIDMIRGEIAKLEAAAAATDTSTPRGKANLRRIENRIKSKEDVINTLLRIKV